MPRFATVLAAVEIKYEPTQLPPIDYPNERANVVPLIAPCAEMTRKAIYGSGRNAESFFSSSNGCQASATTRWAGACGASAQNGTGV
jgi:hypothetical protein